MLIDSTKVEAFKNWFFGRVPQSEYLDDQSFLQVAINVATLEDLPIEGNENRTYYVEATGDTYRFADGIYHIVDFYQYGVDAKYRDTPRKHVPKQTITDPSFNIPSISADQVREGGSPVLSTLYNIQALLTDLEQIRRNKVYGYKTTLMDVLGFGILANREQNVTNWFAKEHRILHRLLVSAYRTKEHFSKEIIDALFKHNYVLTWDSKKHCPVLKIEDFTVYL